MKVVLDTNTLVSALLFTQGNLSWLRELWARGGITPLGSQPTIAEFARVLAYPKFELGESEIRDLMDEYLLFVEAVNVKDSDSRTVELPSCRDPADQVFLELARDGHADVLVTGDSDLLSLANRVTFAIESPADFKKRFDWVDF